MTITTSNTATVQSITKGEYVRRKADTKTTYIRGDYCRTDKRYALINCEDTNRVIYVKRSTVLHIGFTY